MFDIFDTRVYNDSVVYYYGWIGLDFRYNMYAEVYPLGLSNVLCTDGYNIWEY